MTVKRKQEKDNGIRITTVVTAFAVLIVINITIPIAERSTNYEEK